MAGIRILDCTLRDGGYVNHFAFGDRATKLIIDGIVASGVEYVEVGFLRNEKKNSETTVFLSVDEITPYLPSQRTVGGYFAMIVYGQYDLDKLPEKKACGIDGIRVTFKKNEIDDALAYICSIRAKGYIVSANPTGIHAYSDQEFIALLEKINNIQPDIFALVDTLGLLKRTELLRLFYLVEHNLSPQIALAFHSHNNLQMSFAHAQTLIEAGMKRPLIIDTSLRGMGRGAGNLCTELLLQYLNDSQDKQYNLVPLLVIIDEFIDKIHSKTPWGYNLPYYLAASLRCHPNYAAFLSDKGTVPIAAISDILSSVPEEKKSTYDKLLIQKLYLTYLADKVDDSQTLRKLQEEIGQRTVLLLGPGSTMYTEREKILNYIAENNPYIVSVNFRPKRIAVDKVFISNIRRFEEQSDYSNVIITSNIKNTNLPQLDYSSYLNDSAQADSALLMILQVLIRIGIKSISCAGMDGYGEFKTNFYRADISAQPIISGEDRRNEDISAELQRLSEKIGIHFITTTRYRLS